MGERPRRGIWNLAEKYEFRERPFSFLLNHARLRLASIFAPASLKRRRVAGLPGGIRMSLAPSEGMQRSLYLYGCHEFATTKFIRSYLRPGMTFVEAGANIGFFTLTAARAVGEAGRVHAFEPVPFIFEQLVENVRLNGFANVALNRQALSDKSGEAAVFIPREVRDGENIGLSSLAVQPTFTGEERHAVFCATLDEYCSREGIGHIDLLKIDTEGAELLVLKGAAAALRDGKIGALVIEHPIDTAAAFGYRPEEIPALLEGLGYKIKTICWGRKGLELAEGVRPGLTRYWEALNIAALREGRREAVPGASFNPKGG